MMPFLKTNGWQEQPFPSCSSIQTAWLMRPGALTTGLRTLGQFHLRVVFEGIESPRLEDRALFGDGPVWNREVLMSINNRPCVLARSLTPLRASHGCWQGIRRLSSRPLADILYQDPQIVRSRFEISRIGRHHGLFQSLQRSGLELNLDCALLARRSVFWRQHQPLMVSECFLPDFWSMVL